MPAARLRTLLDATTHALLAPAMAAWLRSSPRSWRLLPNPGVVQRSAARGPNADRLLMVGSGIAVGYGVTSPDLALGGYLARSVAARTARGASIETIAGFTLRADDVANILEGFELKRFDALLLSLGTDEALHLATVASFRAHLVHLLDWLEQNAPHRLGVMMVGIPDITSMMKLPPLLERLVQKRCFQLDAELRRVCQGYDRVLYQPFSPVPSDLERDGDRRFYEAWAKLLEPRVSLMLNAHLADPPDPATILELRRQLALDDLGILDSPIEARYQRIVVDARRAFGVQGASITFIDRERQWSKAVVGMDAIDSPRGSALGDATVNNGKLLVVEDARADDRFSGHPWVAGASSVRFFAGFPIEAANGERIGALCICDSEPRTFSAEDDAMLGVLAGQVQDELWGAGSRAVVVR